MANVNLKLPITQIGEQNWVDKLRDYLEEYEVECIGAAPGLIIETEERLGIRLSEEMKAYYLNFGGIDSADFMYNLKKLDEFEFVSNANLSFIGLNFRISEINNLVVFAESPGNDPLCFSKSSDTIYLFSHDPVKKAKVFENFNQYLLHELIELEKLLGEFDLDEDQEYDFKKELLPGTDIDYHFRYLKL